MNGDAVGPSVEVNQITERIIGCAFVVSNTLGIGCVEKVYENALAHSLRGAGLQVTQQHPIRVDFDGMVVGEFYAELLVERRVLVELKAATALAREHTAQALNYLRASGLELCLLINFGTTKAEIKRLRPSVYWRKPHLPT